MRYYYVYYWLWKRVTIRLRPGGYNDYSGANAVIFISAWQVLNAFYLIEHVLFTDERGCGACDSRGRLYLLGGAMFGIYVANNVVFWRLDESPDAFAPLRTRTKRAWIWVTAAYVSASLYLVFYN